MRNRGPCVAPPPHLSAPPRPPTRLLFARLLLNVHVQSCRDLRVSPLLSALCMRQYNTPGGVRALGAGGAGARGSRAKAARGMLRRSNASVYACGVLRRHPFVLLRGVMPEFSMTVGPCVPAPAPRPRPRPRARVPILSLLGSHSPSTYPILTS